MAELTETQRVFCPACGTPNPLTNRFCGSCGHPLPELVPTPAPVASTPARPPASVTPAAPVIVSPDIARAFPEFGAKPVVPRAVPPVPPAAATRRAPVVDTSPAEPPKPPAGLVVPADLMARERERERLITEATRQRIKGLVTEARETLERALAFAEGAPAPVIAPLYEQIGDLLQDEDRIKEALAAYRKATEVDPKRASAEKKLATLTLSVASQRPENQLSDTLIHGDSVMGLLTSGGLRPRTGKRNAGVAMMMSMLIPGFGQFYNGQVLKGILLLIGFAISLLLLTLLHDGSAAFGTISSLFAARAPRGGGTISPTTWGVILFGVAVWLYAIVDAPFYAAKAGREDSDLPLQPTIDKTGWEV